jgi:hypothetical protein
MNYMLDWLTGKWTHRDDVAIAFLWGMATGVALLSFSLGLQK